MKQARRQQQHLEDEIMEQEGSSGSVGLKGIKPKVSLGNTGADSNESSDDDAEFTVPSATPGDYEEVVCCIYDNKN